MIHRLILVAGLSAGFVLSGLASAQTRAAAPDRKVDKAAAYFNFAMGHMYAELAGNYGNRGEYVNKAIEYYRAALKADPSAGFIAEELSELYVQSGQIRAAVLENEEAVKQNPDDLNARRILGRIYSRLIGDSTQNRLNEDMLKKAIEQYARVTEKDPQDLDSWLMLGRLNMFAQNSVEAQKAYQKVLDREPNNEDALSGLALVSSNLGDHKKATELLERVVAKSPNLRSLTALAASYEQMRDYKLAAQTLKRAVEVSGGNPDLERALGQNLLQAGQDDEALAVFEELAAAEPKDVISHLRLSQLYRQKGDFAKARAAADKALELEPNSIEVRYNQVELLEAENKSAEAVDVLRKLLAATERKSYSPGDRRNRVLLLERLGLLHRSLEQPAEAVAVFRQMGELDSEQAPRAAAQIVETWRGAREYTKAKDEADAALKKFPQDRMLQVVHANLLADMGRGNDAIAELKKLLDGKSDRETHLSIAQLAERAKNYSEMGKSLDAAEKLSTTNEEKEGVFFMRGAMYEKQKKYDLAEAEFRKVLAISPESTSALNYLGYMFADRGVRLQEALAMIQKAVDKEPNNGAYLDSLGWVLFKLDKLPEAEKYLLRAVERAPKDPTVRDHLGDLYARQGRLKDAAAAWQRSIEEWNASAPAERDPAEVAKVQKKLEGAKVRLAKEAGSNSTAKPQ